MASRLKDDTKAYSKRTTYKSIQEVRERDLITLLLHYYYSVTITTIIIM